MAFGKARKAIHPPGNEYQNQMKGFLRYFGSVFIGPLRKLIFFEGVSFSWSFEQDGSFELFIRFCIIIYIILSENWNYAQVTII